MAAEQNLTAEREAALRRAHVERPGRWCGICLEDSPCAPLLLLRRLDAERGRAAGLRVALEDIRQHVSTAIDETDIDMDWIEKRVGLALAAASDAAPTGEHP